MFASKISSLLSVMDNREELARISVGTVQDWQRLKSNYREDMLRSIQAQIASNKGLGREQDAILAYIDQYIEKTFNFVQPNLRINGNAFEFLDVAGREMEPFDEALDRRIWSLADTRLQWHKRIAETRRTIPKELETNVSTLLERHRGIDTVDLSYPEEDIDEPMTEENIMPENVQDTVQKMSALCNELNQTTTRQKERAERLRAIAPEVRSFHA